MSVNDYDHAPPPTDDDYTAPDMGVVLPFAPPPVPESAPPPPADFDRAVHRADNPSVIHVNRLDPFGVVVAAWEAIRVANGHNEKIAAAVAVSQEVLKTIRPPSESPD